MNTGWLQPEPVGWQEIFDHELETDIGSGDLSALALNSDQVVDWYIEAQQTGVLCGVGAAAYILQTDGILRQDGQAVDNKTWVLEGRGPVGFVLQRERTALNALMHLSGVASATSRLVNIVAGTGVVITDTRKTTPGLRHLQKYATRCGGAKNHRFGLYDAVMLKDNHIAACGGIAGALAKVKPLIGHLVKVEVEVSNIAQMEEAIEFGADVVMLDNMTCEQMRECVTQNNNRVILEASGGITESTIRLVAETGVDIISVGAITHSAPALSLHLELK